MKSARQLAMELLLRMERDEAYSNLLLDRALDELTDPKERALATALFYGVLERRITLDYIIAGLSALPMGKLAPEVLQILRLGLYQILYMNAIPESAAVNESVRLTQLSKKASAKGFVNAVLRTFIRNGKAYKLSGLSPLEALSVQYSCPLWLVEKWDREYGRAEEILKASVGRPPLAIRVNTTKTTGIELPQQLAESGILAEPADVCDALLLSHTGDLERSQAYQGGLFHVQDLSSQRCCALLDPQPGEVVLDVCAAPGGKSFTIAQRMQNRGRVLSLDLHESRVRLIEGGAKRLGLSCIEAAVSDAAKPNPAMPRADRVLCDVPCSGLGIIRRKPEIKYKPAPVHEGLPAVQLQILAVSADYVKPAGVLVYSTCTLSRAENDEVVQAFLGSHADFSELERHTFFPKPKGGDGFFISKLVRNGA